MKYLIGIILLTMAISAAILYYAESKYEYICNDFEIIEIVSAKHRNVKIKLSNNEIIDIYQPSVLLKKGDLYQYCLMIEI